MVAALTGFSAAAWAGIPASERTVLLNLYGNTLGNFWNNNSNWLGPPGTECTWFGITCDVAGQTVIGINLRGNNLNGNLPSLSALSHLQQLIVPNGGEGSITFNNLVGTVPPRNGLAELQHVEIGGQSFSGPLPALAGLSNLAYFSANYGFFVGAIPSLDGLVNLSYFNVDHNLLSGPLPPLSGLTNLTYFNVIQDQLSGPIPALHGLTKLQDFYVFGNHLTGSVPDMSGLTQLNDFEVGSNLLNGPLSGSLTGLPNLQTLDVSDGLLTGPVPDISGLTSLQNFGVDDNRFTGSVPDPSSLIQLQYYSIGDNLFTGAAPTPPPQALKGAFLCFNNLTPSASPPSAVDTYWDTATGSTPWSAGCTQKPVATQIKVLNTGPNPALPGQAGSYTAVVYGGSSPSGTINFAWQDIVPATGSTPTPLCANVPLVDGIASCPVPGGTFVINGVWYEDTYVVATYSGDANNAAASTGNTYGAEQITLLLPQEAANINPAQIGQAVDLVANVTDALSEYEGAYTVSFFDGTQALCRGVAIVPIGVDVSHIPIMRAHCATSFNSTGTHALTVQYDNAEATPTTPLSETVIAAVPFDADQFALTGSWYYPATSGQGMLLDVAPDLSSPGVGALFTAWFTYDALGNPQWYTLQGNLSSPHGSAYAATIYLNQGGNFNAPPATHAAADGTATVTFSDCAHATLAYQFNDGRMGSIPYTRLTAPSNCCSAVPAQPSASPPVNYNDVLHSGAWYNPATSGQGVLVDIDPSQSVFAAAWFTYAPQAEGLTGQSAQRWFTLQAPYTPGNLTLSNVPIYMTVGGLFNTTTITSAVPVGTANIAFTSCNTMTLQYQFTTGEFLGENSSTPAKGSINEQTIVPVAGCQ